MDDHRLIDSTKLKTCEGDEGLYSAEAQYLFWKVEYQRRNPSFYDFFENMVEAIGEPFRDSQEILNKVINDRETSQNLQFPSIQKIFPFEFYGNDKHLLKWRIGGPNSEIKKIGGKRVVELKDPTQTGENLHIENFISLSRWQWDQIKRQIEQKAQAYREYKELYLERKEKLQAKVKKDGGLNLESFDLEKDYDYSYECGLAQEGSLFDPTAYMTEDEVMPRRDSVLSRACSLWLWDFIRENECSKAEAIQILHNSFNIKKWYEPREDSRDRLFERHIRCTDKCIKAGAVLPFR